MGPDEDVRTVTGGGGLLELVGSTVGVRHFDLDPGVGGELLADLGQAFVTLVAIDPDNQLAFLDGRLSRQRQAQGGGQADGGSTKQLFVHEYCPRGFLLLIHNHCMPVDGRAALASSGRTTRATSSPGAAREGVETGA
ncbi:hypothetical protein D3C84_575860 [compost metagenome]